MRMKNHLKTKEMSRQKVSKQSNFNRKRAQKKSVKAKGNKKNGAKRKPCVKRRRSQEKRCQKIRMPRERDVNGKRLKRHRFQETATTSEEHCQERRVCQVSGFKAVNKKGCQDSVSGASRIKRKWQHQTRMAFPRADAVNGHASRGVGRRSYRLFLFFIDFSLSKLPSPGWPGLYL